MATPTSEQTETTPSKTVSNRPTLYPSTSVDHKQNPNHYSTLTQTQNAVSFSLPTVDLPDGYEFVRAAVIHRDDTANTNTVYVGLVYVNRSDSETQWATIELDHPNPGMKPEIGETVSIGAGTGAYYRDPNGGHIHFACDNSGYEITGWFTKKQLIQIAESICRQ